MQRLLTEDEKAEIIEREWAKARAKNPKVVMRVTVYAPMTAAFHKSLSEAGYFEPQNVTIEYRWAESQLERLPELAADVVRRQVSVIFTGGGSGPCLAAKAATSKIPIVFANGTDPVEARLVASLSPARR
jgi:putative tryptophan/tyrosine transport system substrate-binding protein